MPYSSDTTQWWILHVIFHNVFKWYSGVCHRKTAAWWITYWRSTSCIQLNIHPSYREKNCRKQSELHLVLLLTSNSETFFWAEGSMLRKVFQPTKLSTLYDHFSSSPRPTETSIGDRKR